MKMTYDDLTGEQQEQVAAAYLESRQKDFKKYGQNEIDATIRKELRNNEDVFWFLDDLDDEGQAAALEGKSIG
jgi:hypothetical protein